VESGYRTERPVPPALNPRVLIVNDDGIDAPGIVLLEEIARQFTNDVWVVAPDEERSGAGHSLSMSHPIRMRQRDERHFAVKGTPTTAPCSGSTSDDGPKARPAAERDQPRPNLAEDITYSGTASAAIGSCWAFRPSRSADHPLPA
jgi:5'-nucleotidase